MGCREHQGILLACTMRLLAMPVHDALHMLLQIVQAVSMGCDESTALSSVQDQLQAKR